MIQNKKILAIIPARKGSKRLKNKNIKNFCGKPLIQWTIDQAINCSLIDKVFVSTDSEIIKNISIKTGAEVPFLRPDNLSQDNSSTNECIIHFLENIKEHYDIIVLLQTTSPLRQSFHISESIQKFISTDNIESLVSVKKKSNPPANASKSIYDLYNSATNSLNEIKMPKYFSPNGAIYISTSDIFLINKTFYTKKTYLYAMDDKYSVDIDYKDDFLYAQRMFKKNITFK